MQWEGRLAGLFDVPVAIATADAATELSALLPLEAAVVGPRWSPKRTWEYQAGRHCARRALDALGIDPGAGVGKDASGAPLWPEGVRGSITHTGSLESRFAACVVTTQARSVGLDAELDEPLAPELLSRVLTAAEWASARRDFDSDLELRRHALRVFSAKEAFYKCQYPLTQVFLGFHDVETRFTPEEGRFTVWSPRLLTVPSGAGGGTGLTGRFAVHAGRVVTAAAWPL
jgi:4'-phosphopantetheinyl transferase EntD